MSVETGRSGQRPAPLIFDLDHTLWDFAANSKKSLIEGFEHFRLDLLGIESSEQWVNAFEVANDRCWALYRSGEIDKSTLRTERFRLTLESLGCDDGELAVSLGVHYVEVSPLQTTLIEGSEALLSELAARGHRMWVLTNGFEEVQRIKLARCGLAQFFEAMYTSEQLGAKKPHAQAFFGAAQLAGLEPDEGIVMIGDSYGSDIIGAQNVGWRGVHYNPQGEVHEDAWRTVRQLREILDLELNH